MKTIHIFNYAYENDDPEKAVEVRADCSRWIDHTSAVYFDSVSVLTVNCLDCLNKRIQIIEEETKRLNWYNDILKHIRSELI